MKRKSKKARLLRARIRGVVHAVHLFVGEPSWRWLTVICENASTSVPPRHYPVPWYAQLTRASVDCMTCLVVSR